LFTFDIDASAAGKTCQLIFLLTGQRYTITGTRGLNAYTLVSPVNNGTSYDTLPIHNFLGQSNNNLDSGDTVNFGWRSCGSAGQRSYLIEATGNLNLTYLKQEESRSWVLGFGCVNKRQCGLGKAERED
jgi:hypothetical protein